MSRSDEEVDDLMNDLADSADSGVSRFPGMSYEDGVHAAIGWLKGETDDHPYPEA